MQAVIDIDAQKKEISELVGAKIKYFRHMRSFSQEELALRANLNPAYYGQVERGAKCPTIDTLYKISKALDVPLSDLLRVEIVSGAPPTSVHRISDLLTRVPPDKLERVLDIIENIVKLL